MYPSINLKLTGINLRKKIKDAGYNVKFIQRYLHLSCPQPIYRWFSGKTLPSVDHLYALSKLLGVHMEELIISGPYIFLNVWYKDNKTAFAMLDVLVQSMFTKTVFSDKNIRPSEA